jgi:hypothetical protein
MNTSVSYTMTLRPKRRILPAKRGIHLQIRVIQNETAPNARGVKGG